MLSTEARDPAAEVVDLSRIAVLVPCYNEETAIAKVVTELGRLPRRTSRLTPPV